MQYYELTFTVQLAEDTHFSYAGEKLGQSIGRAMLQDSELTAMHGRTGFKHYSFNCFYPVESGGVYKAGRVYIYRICSLNETFVKKIKALLPKTETSFYKILSIQSKTIKNKFISNLYTLTPAIITVDGGKNWIKENDFLHLQSRLQANLEKKYNEFFGPEFDKSDNWTFIQRIELLNQKPMEVHYKGITLLGNKFKIWVNEDERSQKLAFIALACGLGEKNSSVGAGFCTGGDRG